jgi:hypothetical protein
MSVELPGRNPSTIIGALGSSFHLENPDSANEEKYPNKG